MPRDHSSGMTLGQGPSIRRSRHRATSQAIVAAAQEPEVERIFVNAAIKKAPARRKGGSAAGLQWVLLIEGHD